VDKERLVRMDQVHRNHARLMYDVPWNGGEDVQVTLTTKPGSFNTHRYSLLEIVSPASLMSK